ncbi:MAG: hypothetical protein KAT14_05235 [Candidatus Marinimicrobia bacterium]|nr:hypothetical protein [Candidatus Neomarinimicrobiota bacterium]
MEPVALRRFTQNAEKKILFCGDDNIDLAAIYLSSILYAEGYDFDYIPSALQFPHELDINSYDLIIFSDYSRTQSTNKQLLAVKRYIENGGSFLMIGGWESFTGLNIEYKNSPIEDVLPVFLQDTDDCINYDQGIIVMQGKEKHPINRGLDWERPGIIGGYNAFIQKPGTELCLLGVKMHISNNQDAIQIQFCEEDIPLLVIGNAEKGKVGALAFDLAPHWIGGFIDWGKQRKRINFNNGFIEVGDMYYRFVKNLIVSMF